MFLLRLIVTLALWAVIYSRIRTGGVLAALAGVSPAWIACAVILNLAFMVTVTARWKLLVNTGGERLRLWALLRAYFVSYFYGVMAPGTLGVDAARIYLLGRQIGSRSKAAVSVLLDRLFGLGGNAVVALAVLWGFRSALPFPPGVIIALAAAVAVGMVVGIVLISRRDRPEPTDTAPYVGQAFRLAGHGRAEALPHQASRVARAVEAIRQEAHRYRSRPSFLLAPIGLSAAAILLWGGVGYCTLASLSVFIPFLPLVGFIIVAELASAVPASFQGLGVREVLFLALLQPYGVRPVEAALLGLLLYGQILINGAIGGCLTLVGTALPRTLRRPIMGGDQDVDLTAH